jgi:hypothetical protein
VEVQVYREREFLYGRRWATRALALEEADEQKARVPPRGRHPHLVVRGVQWIVYSSRRPRARTPALAISIGTAVLTHDGESYETLLTTADGRMYPDKARRKMRRPTSL